MIQLSKIYRFLLGLAFLAFLNSCSEEAPIESEITYYPTFEVVGGQYIMVESGTTFNDPGVIASAGEDELPVTISGSVNTSQIGVYALSYSATNDDGFSASTSRYVLVTNDPGLIAGNDLSGAYTSATNATHKMNVTKIADGFYEASDLLPPNNIKAVIVQVSDTELTVPAQSSPFGEIGAGPTVFAGSSATLVGGSDISLSLYISCCGIFNRTFLKD